MGLAELFGVAPNVNKLHERHDLRGLLKALNHKRADIRLAAADALAELVPYLRNNVEVRQLTALGFGFFQQTLADLYDGGHNIQELQHNKERWKAYWLESRDQFRIN